MPLFWVSSMFILVFVIMVMILFYMLDSYNSMESDVEHLKLNRFWMW